MAAKGKFNRKKAAENLGKTLKAFGDTISEILDDPDLREKAKAFAQSAVDAAAKVVESKIEDDQVKSKFHDVGNAAKNLGQSLSEHFKAAPEQ